MTIVLDCQKLNKICFQSLGNLDVLRIAKTSCNSSPGLEVLPSTTKHSCKLWVGELDYTSENGLATQVEIMKGHVAMLMCNSLQKRFYDYRPVSC